MYVRLNGGKLDGEQHKMMWPLGADIMPDCIAVPTESELIWYKRNQAGEYHYLRTEERTVVTHGEEQT